MCGIETGIQTHVWLYMPGGVQRGATDRRPSSSLELLKGDGLCLSASPTRPSQDPVMVAQDAAAVGDPQRMEEELPVLARVLRIQVVPQGDAKLFPYRLELLQVLVVLALVLNFGSDGCGEDETLTIGPMLTHRGPGRGQCEEVEGHTLEYSHGGGKVIDPPGGPEGGGDDGGRGDQVVGEGVVEVALQLEDVVDALEFLLVSAGDGSANDAGAAAAAAACSSENGTQAAPRLQACEGGSVLGCVHMSKISAVIRWHQAGRSRVPTPSHPR